MSIIKVLPVALRNKIAAGEVIERPASVVKELIENSVDAGSGEVTIEISRGGKGVIRVTDTGKGMTREDALMSFERHATSKLRSEADLFNISTMGFRGEALPAIASVSQIKLITGQDGASTGTCIEIEGGEVKSVKDHPGNGTSVEVRNLFFNTPARRKFLKSDSTELYHIIDAVTKEALGHWETGFRLFAGKQETMTLPRTSSPRERVMHIFGSEFVEGLTKIEGIEKGLTLTAFISKGDNFRSGRSHQYILINRRPVKDQMISHAVYSGFEGILPHDKHPVFFLFFEIDPERIDVNVHPAKREVRFENKDEIHRFISRSVREAVREERTERMQDAGYTSHRIHDSGFRIQDSAGHASCIMDRGSFPNGSDGPPMADHASRNVSENLDFPYQPSLPFIYLGDTFVAVTGKGGLMLIDHHAAHERILYEDFLKGVNLNSHPLLFPKQVRLSHKEHKLILENKEMIEGFGMEVDDFGHDTLIVRTLPDALDTADLRGILADVAAALEEGDRPFGSIRKAISAKIACHSSVRGRTILKEEGLQKLLARLDDTEFPDQCPHGRPTRLFFSLDDLKRMFKRK